MVEESLLTRGIKRKIGPPQPDLETCKLYKPVDVCKLGLAVSDSGLITTALFMSNYWPDWLVSGYRTNRETTPHAWGDAFDIKIGTILRQIEFIRKTVVENRIFNRGGLYAREYYKDNNGREYVGLRNTCHIDNRDEAWMKKYRGAKYWVYDLGAYIGFWEFEAAAHHALRVSQEIGGVS